MANRFELPVMNGLLTFEAAARTGSFTAAAQELHISQPAVSHSIRKLEDAIGVVLFDRQHKGVKVTVAGQQLLEQAGLGLTLIEQALKDVKATKPNQPVSLAVSTATATWWLLPRIARFKLKHPQIELRCITIDDDKDIEQDQVDLAIPLGSGEFSKHRRWPFVNEEIYAVCSPSYLAAQGPITKPADLVHHTLLHLEERYRSRMDWATWLSRFGVSLPKGNKQFRFNDYSIILQAALEGQGIALGWGHLIKAALTQGQLVQVIADKVQTQHPFQIIAGRNRPLRPDVIALKDWLVAEAGNT